MKITLKKIVYCGIALLILLAFLFVLVLPVSLNLGTAQYSGSVMGLLAGDEGLIGIFRSDTLATVVSTGTGANAINDAIAVLYATFSVMGTIGVVMLIICFLATVGAFFIPSMKGARGVTIPFFAIAVIYFTVLGGLEIALGQVSVAVAGNGASVAAPCAISAFLAWVLFLGLLIAPGIVREKVLVDTRKKKEPKEEK